MSYCDYHEVDHGKGGCPRCNADRATEKKVPMKAWRVSVNGFDDCFAHAETASKARHRAVDSLKDAWSGQYSYRDVRVVRHPALDAKRIYPDFPAICPNCEICGRRA